jgi:hypothetical protein
MRSFFIAVTALMLLATGAAQAKVFITVDKDAQMMTVAVDGSERYHWPVSTGIPSYETPNGSFRTFRMEEDHFSKEFDDAPMPHSIFFTKIGHAIHGTDSEGRLGTPASHGCVRLSRAHAAALYALVQQEGVLNTTVTLTGSSQVALARNPRRANTAVARQDPAQYPAQSQYPQSNEPAIPSYWHRRRPRPASSCRKPASTTVTSIRPTAAPAIRAIRRRARPGASTTGRFIISGSQLTKIAAPTTPNPRHRSTRRGSAACSATRIDALKRHDFSSNRLPLYPFV